MPVGQLLAPPPPNQSNSASKDLRVLLSLRHKTKVISKGKVTTNPTEDAVRIRAEQAADQQTAAAGILEPTYGSRGQKAPHLDLSVAELKQEVEMSADVEAWRRTKQHGIENLVDPMLKQRRLSQMSTEAGNQLLMTLEQVSPHRKSLAEDQLLNTAPAEERETEIAETQAIAQNVKPDKQKVQAVFASQDGVQSGFLKLPQIQEGLRKLGLDLTVEDVTGFMREIGIRPNSSVDPQEFAALVGVVHESYEPALSHTGQVLNMDSPVPRKRDRRGSGSSSSSSSLSSSSSSAYASENSWSASESEYSVDTWGSRSSADSLQADRARLRSPRATNDYADELLQNRLKAMEKELREKINRGKGERQIRFRRNLQRGNIQYIAPERYVPEARALYSGPVNANNVPEGVGCFDYKKFVETRGHVIAERRVYYAGVVVEGMRQGLGLLRWLDQTEYCGSWDADMPHGSGLETYTDGSWYTGGFQDDKRHGMGGVWTNKGMVYLGQWSHGVRHGIGIIGHTDVVQVDRKGDGNLQEVALSMDMSTMKLSHPFPPLSNRRGAMREDVMRSIFNKRYSRDAAKNVIPFFIVEYDRGVQSRSIWYSSDNEHHLQLLRDAVHSTMSSQVVALEALELAKEGLMRRRQAMHSNEIRRKREQQQLNRTGRARYDAEEYETVRSVGPSLAVTQPIAEFDVIGSGLRADSLTVTVVSGSSMPIQDEENQVAADAKLFVLVTLDEHRRQTEEVAATQDPQWDETFSFPVTSSWSDMVCSVYRTPALTDKAPGKETLLLRVTVVEARGLKALDAGGSSDPYAVVRLGDQRFSTKVVTKDLNPTWDAAFELYVEDASQMLEVSVWDRDLFNADDLIGKVEISLNGRGGRMAGQEWFDLMDGAEKHGHIAVSVQLPEWTDSSRGEFLGEVRVPVHTLAGKTESETFDLDLQSLRPDKERLQRRRRVLSSALLSWTWYTPKKLLHSDIARVVLTQWHMIAQNARERKSTGQRTELQDGLRRTASRRIEPRNIAQRYQGSLHLRVAVSSSLAEREPPAGGGRCSFEGALAEAEKRDDGAGLLRVRLVRGQRLPCLSESAKVYCKLSLGDESVSSTARDCFPSTTWDESFPLHLHAGVANLRVEAYREANDGGSDVRLGHISVSTADMLCDEAITAWHPLQAAHDTGIRLRVRVVETRGLVKHKGSIFARIDLGNVQCSTPACKSAEFKERSPIPYIVQAGSMEDLLCVSMWQQAAGGQEVFHGQCILSVGQIVHSSSPEFPFDQWFDLRERVSESPEVVSGKLRLVVSVDPTLPPRQGELQLEVEVLKEKDPVVERPPRPSAKSNAKAGLVQVTVHEASSLVETDLAGLLCELRVSKHAERTEVVQDLTDSVWDQTFLLATPLNPQTLKATVISRQWLLRLNVMRATGLKAMDVGGTSDPYVIVKLGDVIRKTAVINKNLNPTWDETLELVIRDKSQVLEVSVWDKDLIGADDLIGTTEISLYGRANRGRAEEWYDLLDEADENGKLLLGVEVVKSREEDAKSGGERPVGFVEVDLQEFEIGQKTSQVHPLYLGDEHYTLSVSVLEGNGLISVDSIASDPYVVVSIESQTFTTPVVKQDCDPVWENERFTFRVSNLDSVLTCDVFDYNAVQSHVFMGRFSMSAADIIQGEVHESACPLRLKPDQRDAVHRRVKAGESLGSLKLAYQLVKTSVPSCSLHLSVLSLHPPQFSRPQRHSRLITYRAARGVGTLELTVIGARSLTGGGKHGVYCEILVGDESRKSKEVHAGPSPTWDEAHSYSVAPGTTSARVQVLSKGKRGRILLLGEAVMLLQDLVGRNEIDVWNRLDGRYKLGRVLIRVQSAAGLMAADPTGTSDPFAQVTVGKRRRTTKVKKKTLDPVWEEEMLFDVWSVLDVIKIEVFDWDRVSNNDLLGLVELPVERIMRMCKDGERLGEGHADAGLVLPLTGVRGTPFVDEDRTQRAQGSISVEVEFRGDYGLRAKVGWLRTVASYVSPAMSAAEAADMDMALVDTREGDEEHAGADEAALEEVERQLAGAIRERSSGAVLTRKMLNRPGLNSDSLQAQIDLFTSHGGNVLGPYAAPVQSLTDEPHRRPPPTKTEALLRRGRASRAEVPEAQGAQRTRHS